MGKDSKKPSKRPTPQKRHLQSVKRNERNRFYKGQMRNKTKEFRTSLKGGDKEVSAKLLSTNVKLIQKMAQKGIIHKNQADRRVSRLQKSFNVVFTN